MAHLLGPTPPILPVVPQASGIVPSAAQRAYLLPLLLLGPPITNGIVAIVEQPPPGPQPLAQTLGSGRPVVLYGSKGGPEGRGSHAVFLSTQGGVAVA